MQFSEMSRQEWDALPFWSRVNRRTVALLALTFGVMLILFLPVIFGVLGDILLGNVGALIGVVLGMVAWVWVGSALIEWAK